MRLNRLKASEEASEAWLRSRNSLEPVRWCDSGWFLTPKKDESSPKPFKQPVGKSLPHLLGHLYSQEAASMLPAEVLKTLLSELLMASSPGDPLLVLDLCAAPGGKAIQLAEALEGERNASACSILVANDPNAERAMRLRANLLRCGAQSVMVSEMLGEDFVQLPGTFHAVLVDAPCSAEANVRRDRKVLERWRVGKKSEAYSRLLRRQEILLKSAWTALKPGGYMVYSTCTFNHFENEGQCEQFLSRNPDARVVDLSFKDWGCSLSQKYLRVWPQSFDTEGFFVAAFQKDEVTEMGQVHSEPLKLPRERVPRFHELFSKSRLLDWRRVAGIRRQIRREEGVSEIRGTLLGVLMRKRESYYLGIFSLGGPLNFLKTPRWASGLEVRMVRSTSWWRMTMASGCCQ